MKQKIGLIEIYGLTFISDEKLREVIHRSTNKVEQYNAFEDWITFAGAGTIYERAYIEQEKCIKYTVLIASCVMLDNTVEISNALNALAREGLIPTMDELAALSPIKPGILSASGTTSWTFRRYRLPSLMI